MRENYRTTFPIIPCSSVKNRISLFSAKKLVCQETWNTFYSDHFASTFELVNRSFPGGLEGSITVHCYITAWKWWQNYITQHSFLQTPSMYSCYDQTVMFFYIWLLLPQYLLPYSLVHLISPQVSLLYFLLIRCNTHLSSPSLSRCGCSSVVFRWSLKCL